MDAKSKLALIEMDIKRALKTGINCQHAKDTLDGILWLISLQNPAIESTGEVMDNIIPFPDHG